MNRDDVIKFIDGKIFYYSDYVNFLYEQLQLRDEIIKEAREYIEDKWKRDYYYEDIDNCCKFCVFSEFEYEDFLEILNKVQNEENK